MYSFIFNLKKLYFPNIYIYIYILYNYQTLNVFLIIPASPTTLTAIFNNHLHNQIYEIIIIRKKKIMHEICKS